MTSEIGISVNPVTMTWIFSLKKSARPDESVGLYPVIKKSRYE